MVGSVVLPLCSSPRITSCIGDLVADEPIISKSLMQPTSLQVRVFSNSESPRKCRGLTQTLLDRVEPFNATPGSPPVSAGFNGRGPQSAYSDGSSNQPLNPTFGQTVSNSQYTQSGPSEPGVTHVSGISAQPRTGKAALMAQQYDNVQQPVQLEDSGVRFNEDGEQAGPSQLPTEVPPTYTPN